MKPHPLSELVKQQAETFDNKNATEEDRIEIYKKIQKLQKEIAKGNGER